MTDNIHFQPAMTTREVYASRDRGAAFAKTLAPLHSDGGFRFPHATKFAADKFGPNSAADMALENAKGAANIIDARRYVATCCKTRSGAL